MRFFSVVLLFVTTISVGENPSDFLSYLGYRLGMSYEDAVNAPLPPYFEADRPKWECRDHAVDSGRTAETDKHVIESCSMVVGLSWRPHAYIFQLTFLNHKLIGLYMSIDKDYYPPLKLAFERKYGYLNPSTTAARYTNAFGGIFEGEQVTYSVKQRGDTTALILNQVDGNQEMCSLRLTDTVKMKAWESMKTALHLPPI